MNGDNIKKEFWDYQTPLYFASHVCSYLSNNLNLQPKTIIEPTVGMGAFIEANIAQFEDCKEIVGIEINRDYCKYWEDKFQDERIHIINEDFFKYNINKLLFNRAEVLVVGNPPWVTNSELNFNLPEKTNFKGLSGTDAITGASNFDICENIILKLIKDFRNTKPSRIISTIRCENGVLSNDNESVMDFEGKSQFEWRQGVKHDCSSIMELEIVDEQTYINKKKHLCTHW